MPLSPPRAWPSLLVGAVSGVLALGGAWVAPWRLAAGGGWTEAPGHLAGMWITARGLLQHGPLWRVDPGIGWPEGFSGHLIDPASLLLFLPGWLLGGLGPTGAVLGWNLLHLLPVLLGLWGMHALARRIVAGEDAASAWARAVAVAALGFAPYWLAEPWLGRTEYLVLLLLPAQLAALWAFVQSGRRRDGLLAALLLGLCGMNTGYNGVFALLVQLPVALALLARNPRALGRLLAVAAGALLVALPGALALRADAVVGARLLELNAAPPAREPLCLLVRACAAPDLSRLLEQPLVIGLAVLGLGLAGAVARPRLALPWLALAAWLVAWGLGPAIPLGDGRQLLLPAGMASAVLPPLAAIKEWSRLGTVLPLSTGLAAAIGARALLLRLGQQLPPASLHAAGLALVVVIALDGLTFPRAILAERPAFDPTPPPGQRALLAALPDGPLVPLPVELKPGHDQPIEPGFHVLHHLGHGRPVSATLDAGVDLTVHDSGLVRAALDLRSAALGGPPAPTPGIACLQQDAAALAARGYVAVIVDERQPGADAITTLLTTVLSPPLREQDQAGWALPPADPSARPCLPGRRR